MSKTITGELKYDYKIRIDLADIVERIAEKLKANIIDYDWECDGDEIVMDCSDSCGYKDTHYDATRYEPAEDDTELRGSIDDVDVEQAILDVLHETKRISTDVDVDYDDADFIVDEPDPDLAYELWKERGLCE